MMMMMKIEEISEKYKQLVWQRDAFSKGTKEYERITNEMYYLVGMAKEVCKNEARNIRID